MAAKNKFDALHDAFLQADNNLSLTPEGNGGFTLNDKSLMPSGPTAKPQSTRPQTPAQHQAVEKAAKASVMKRRARVVKPLKGL